jgi:hypothetical protein
MGVTQERKEEVPDEAWVIGGSRKRRPPVWLNSR